MKKLTIVLFLFIGFVSVAQDSHMALNMGASFPLADFAGIKDYKSNGYANQGFVLSFEGNYIPTWYFGIGGALTFSTNFPNQDSMQAGLITELKALSDLPISPDGVESAYTVDNWTYVNFLIGPTFAYPAGSFQFNLKALLGLSIIMPPNQSLSIIQDDVALTAYSDIQDVRFCYNLGTDIIYKMSGNYSLKLGLDYFSANTSYGLDLRQDESTSLSSIDREIKIESLHATLGLAFLF